ncbi:MAG: DUF5320 family protein [Dysgonamonadaceae bacterium]|jgi:hypothetical protein|nr:DUF5320 family protein [Dysgonamonadaceae bacterium]MDD3309057.1 DUF5320 family protein [Dysgonamonadaceae bacterium]MDD3901700.1 DUF5320 family protein [Dysgonamonadaceae bacterium]MDD4399975.1 DUF5320 family protein [Dysgonamonadaceae bacterium]
MSKLNHTGPEGKGPKTGRKLGKCRKTEDEKSKSGELGKGLGKHFHEPEALGKGKRLQYIKNK